VTVHDDIIELTAAEVRHLDADALTALIPTITEGLIAKGEPADEAALAASSNLPALIEHLRENPDIGAVRFCVGLNTVTPLSEQRTKWE
jgi:hypothetical protein